MLTRLSKIALVAAAAFFLLLVVFNNLTDYGSNYGFVHHVLKMDTTFPGNAGMWRSIDQPWVYHAFYVGIILWETAACALLALGAARLWIVRKGTARAFDLAKSLAIAGLTLSLLQWLVAFISVGGEWFLMWQSHTWNGQEAAFRMFTVMGLILLFLSRKDEELAA